MILFFRYILVCSQSGKILELRPLVVILVSLVRVFKEDGRTVFFQREPNINIEF